jgi:hypothetical protein
MKESLCCEAQNICLCKLYVRNVYVNEFGHLQVKSAGTYGRETLSSIIENQGLDPVGPQKLATPVNELHRQQGYGNIRENQFLKLILVC